MTRPLLPPRGIFTSTRLVFHQRLPAALKETALQLMALSWANSQHCTPPLTYVQLAELTGKDARTLRGHLRALRSEQVVLAQEYLDVGVFTVRLASWLFKNEPIGGVVLCEPAAGDLREAPAAGANSPASPDDRAQQARRAKKRVAQEPGEQSAAQKQADVENRPEPKNRADQEPRPNSEVRRELSKALQKELLAGGVFPTLLREIAASPYSEADLRALLAWCRIDAPDAAARLFIGRMRAGAKAPRAYHGKPCDVCGQYGKHAPDCRRRYAQDIYVNG